MIDCCCRENNLRPSCIFWKFWYKTLNVGGFNAYLLIDFGDTAEPRKVCSWIIWEDLLAKVS